MYGTIKQKNHPTQEPLIPPNQGRLSAASNDSAPPMMEDRRGGMRRKKSARNGTVLSNVMSKPHRHKGNNEGATTNNNNLNLEVDGSSAEENNRKIPPKSFVYTMLNPRSDVWQAVWFKWFITCVIVSDLVSFVVSTEPDLGDDYQHVFHFWEGVTSTIFLIEYLTRLVVVTEATKYHERGPFWGRVSYAMTTPALIDFVATFPFFLELATGWELPTLTYLRSFRLLRIMKTSGFAEATSAVKRVIYYNRQILYVAVLICIGLVLVTAVLMYYLRPQDPDYSQEFQSLGATMYLATMMLTGQGGPDGELPWYTKGVVLLTGAFSLGMFAIPASMLTWGFEAEAERMANMAYARNQKPEAASEEDTWSFSSDDYSTDEEYRKIIAGAEEDEDENEDAKARKAFSLADIDGLGNISLTEYLAMSRDQAAKSADVAAVGNKETTTRLNILEKRIEENSQKLDKICRMLEGMQKSK